MGAAPVGMREFIQKNYYGDRTTMIKSLQAQGKTLEQFRRQTRERFIQSALRSKNVSSDPGFPVSLA